MSLARTHLVLARLDCGLSQQAFAREAGVSRETVRRAEGGGQISAATAKKLGDVVGLSPLEVLGAATDGRRAA
jgi:transcriptional regulator with XRE-family HTH domain